MSASAARLNRFDLDFVISSPVKAEDFIRSNFSVFGLLRRQSSRGVWYEEINDEAPGPDPRHLIVASTAADRGDRYPSQGTAIARETPLRWSEVQEISNEITIEYAPSQGQQSTRRLTVTGRQDWSSTQDEVFDLDCARSRSRYGERVASIRCGVIHSPVAAAALGVVLARRLARPRRSFEVSGGAELMDIEPNDVVLVTDDSVYLSAAPARVASVSRSLAGVRLELETIEPPMTSTRRTE
jgi:hypothetical protein